MNRIAVIQVRGGINIKRKIKDTLNLLRLYKKNSCTIINDNPSFLGMLDLLKDFITWGELDKDTMILLLKERGRLPGNQRLTEEYIKKTIPGTIKLISDLKKEGKDIYIISGGFEAAIKVFAEHIKVDASHIFSNVLLFDNEGKYKGFDDSNPLSKNHGKKIMLKELAKLGSILFVGDGVTDLEAKEVVDLFVGFGGVKIREVVKNEADLFIEDKTLEKIKDMAVGKQKLDNSGSM